MTTPFGKQQTWGLASLSAGEQDEVVYGWRDGQDVAGAGLLELAARNHLRPGVQIEPRDGSCVALDASNDALIDMANSAWVTDGADAAIPPLLLGGPEGRRLIAVRASENVDNVDPSIVVHQGWKTGRAGTLGRAADPCFP